VSRGGWDGGHEVAVALPNGSGWRELAVVENRSPLRPMPSRARAAAPLS
jgi:hypothetical protein